MLSFLQDPFWRQAFGTLVGATVSILTAALIHHATLRREREQRLELREIERVKWERQQQEATVAWTRENEATRRAELRETYSEALFELTRLMRGEAGESTAEACKWLNRLLIDFPDAGEEKRSEFEVALQSFSVGRYPTERIYESVAALARGDNRLRFPG